METAQCCVIYIYIHTHGGGAVNESLWLMKLVPLLRSLSFSGERLETHTDPPTVDRPVCCSVHSNSPPTHRIEAETIHHCHHVLELYKTLPRKISGEVLFFSPWAPV